MLNLVKYELRGNYLTILGICITVIIGNLFLMTKEGNWDVAITGLSFFLVIISILAMFISSIKIMSKYLYDDQGYLLFTLPQSGLSILLSRLITSLIQINIVALVSIFMYYLTAERLIFHIFMSMSFGEIVFVLFSYLFGITYSLTLIYFCLVSGKVTIKGITIGKIGSFILFIVLSIALNWIDSAISIQFPQELSMKDFSIVTTSIIDLSSHSSAYANIASEIFNIITFAALFKSTSYLLEKKVNL